MANFKVTGIIDGDTIKVSPNWLVNNKSSNIVKVRGYNKPSQKEDTYFVNKLNQLLKDKEIDLRSGVLYAPESEALLCDVILNGINIATYFANLKV